MTASSLTEKTDALARAHALVQANVDPSLLAQIVKRAEHNAEIVGRLHLGTASTAAAYLVAARERVTQEEIRAQFDDEVAALVLGVQRMAPIAALRSVGASHQRSADQAAQLEALRKMLLAMVQDVRVVLVKLADATSHLRQLAAFEPTSDCRAAGEEALALYAPLANRLGVWQIKWELEDLALRCLDPTAYREIVAQLDERRPDRETYIAQVSESMREELRRASIAGEVYGRPKHIYSIYSKMQKKNLAFADLSDVRALRVVVSSVADCYAALGVAHQIWSPLPREFDDYIAKPKPNGYRSLHTAVVGPDDKILEVQIRTLDMHSNAEYGVAAHWRYKEGAQGAQSARSASEYDRKIAWLRQVMEWRNEVDEMGDLAQLFRAELLQDTVYVLTPQGRLIDLPRGATPIDFAYHVHTDLGHRCRGARVNGAMVSLNHELANGDRVEIIACRDRGPSRDWLNPQLNFLRSNRARAKVRHWFNSLDEQATEQSGRELLEREARRLGVTLPGLETLVERLRQAGVPEMLAAIARGDINSRHLQAALRGESPVALAAPAAATVRAPHRATTATQGILIVGVDRLLTVPAKCCRPIPPDAIVGFVSKGRGVSVHRSSCRNLARLSAERLIEATWGTGKDNGHYTVEVMAECDLSVPPVREALELLAREQVRVIASRTESIDQRSRMSITLDVRNAAQLAALVKALSSLPGVNSAKRA